MKSLNIKLSWGGTGMHTVNTAVKVGDAPMKTTTLPLGKAPVRNLNSAFRTLAKAFDLFSTYGITLPADVDDEVLGATIMLALQTAKMPTDTNFRLLMMQKDFIDQSAKGA